MISTIMMRILIIEYVIIGGVCLFERDYPKALYWWSAGLISFSVLWGMR